MTVSEDAEDFIVAQWHSALADAGLDDADVHLVVCAGAAVSGPPTGASYNRGDELTGALDADGIVVTPEKVREANAHGNISRYRVAVLEDIDPEDPIEVAFLAAVIRHELEHCRQWEAGSQASKLYGLVDQVIDHVCGADAERRGELNNVQPIEADANAASSAYLRRRYRDAIPALAEGDHHFLVDRADPRANPRSSLSARSSSCIGSRMPATIRSACWPAPRSRTSAMGGFLEAATFGDASELATERPGR